MKKSITCMVLAVGFLGSCGLGEGDLDTELTALDAPGTVEALVTVAPTDIQCGEATQVVLTLNGQTGLAGQPRDIMLVLDRSGSMAGTPLSDLKTAAKAFVDIIDENTDGMLDGAISNGTQIGVVSFADTATLDQPLTADANDVKSSIDALTAAGSTNHEAAIVTAQAQLQGSPNSPVMIIMTDGVTTAGGNATDDAQNAQAAGTEIFAIGLGNNINQNQIESWVSNPVSAHAFFTTNSSALQQIFEAIGAAITVPAATDINIQLTVSDSFIASNQAVSKGNLVAMGNSMEWTIDELETEMVTLSYTATHDLTKPGGVIPIHATLTYSDGEGRMLMVNNPTVNVHGCAATLELTPEVDTNIVGDPHTVIATVLDDFGDPVSNINVLFSVTGGPSIVDGDPSNPMPPGGAGVTDANGQTSFTYTNSEASVDTITATAPVQPRVWTELVDTAQKTWLPITVVIDIKPGSDPSSFGADSRGQIPVALLGSASFDVNNIDDSTVRFGDAPTGDAPDSHGHGHLEDYNGDGFMDKIYHFYFPDTNLDPGDTEGCLSGEVNGLDFLGCSDVNIVPN